MKLIILGILAGLTALLVKAVEVFGYTAISPNSATFSTADMIPEYKDPGTRQWGQRVVNNTAYNYRHSDQNLMIAGDYWAASGTELTFDTGRDYTNKYVFIMGYEKVGATTIPETFPAAGSYSIHMKQLTTTYQNLLSDTNFQIKAENAGGITIKCNVIGGSHFAGMIMESRLVVGA
jgi:hypothetical protein